MDKFIIDGGQRIAGCIEVSGSKNAALPVLVASALANGRSVLENVPDVDDVHTICAILRELGVWISCRLDEGIVEVDGSGLKNIRPSYDSVRRMRASFYTAGMLLARMGKAEVPLPGGCSIGSRPVDFHIKVFRALGAEIIIEHGYVIARADHLQGTRIFIERASVGTTVNAILAASMAEGTTVIDNPAKEPEIVDLANHINTMGGSVRGAGTESIKIEGVQELHGAPHEVIPDRIEAGTYIMAGAMAGGDITLSGVLPEHMNMVLGVLKEAGLQFIPDENDLHVKSPDSIHPVDVETAQYPGFPTDLQQPLGVLMSLAQGISVIRETIFESRFKYVDELRRMGAEIKIKRDMVIISGVDRLTGAPVEAYDLRGGAALVIAALAAEGESEVTGVEHIDRGYEDMVGKLAGVGAVIKRISEE